MNTQTQKKLFKRPTAKVTIVFLVTFIFLMVAIISQITYALLKSDKIYKGIYIDNLYVSGKTMGEVTEILVDNYKNQVDKLQLTIKCKDSTEKANLSDYKVAFDIDTAVKNAYDIGRSGNIFDRLGEIIDCVRSNKHIDLPASYDENKIQHLVDSLYNKVHIPVKESELSIQKDNVSIISGHHGETFDKSKALAEIVESIKTLKGGTLEFPLIINQPKKIDVDDYYKKINAQVKDATTKVEKNNVIIVPPVDGRSIDKSSLSSIIAEVEKAEDIKKVLPVNFVKPKITEDDVKALLFKDTLGTASTQFNTANTNNAHRGVNIRLAVSKLNGKIIASNEVFSFNNEVGPRTADAGYKSAHAYVGGKVIDDVGGGICQVSTTLYNSVLFSDLDIISRSNHTFTVGYVPLGRDAAVYYGQVDLKFKNSTKWPIKISCWVTDDNKIYYSLIGTNETPGKTVEFRQKTISTTKYSTVYINDSNLAEGNTKVKTSGSNGYTVETYKTVKMNGEVVSDKKISTSVYKPLNREVIRGTKKSQTNPSQVAPKQTSAPAAQPSAKPTAEPSAKPTLEPSKPNEVIASPNPDI